MPDITRERERKRKRILIPVTGGVGEVNPDMLESLRQDWYKTEPDPIPRVPGAPEVKRVLRPVPETTTVIPDGVGNLSFSVELVKPYKRIALRTVTLYGPAHALYPGGPVRIDSGVGNRVIVTLHNIGDWDCWFGFNQLVAENNGEVIPGSPTAGEPLGGFYSAELDSMVEVWAIMEAAAAGNINRVTVAEYGL